MRQHRRFVPQFDNLGLRITPSGGAGASQTPDSDMLPIPGEGTRMDPSDWIVHVDYSQRPLTTESCIEDLQTSFDSLDGRAG